jgi:hypothetical protein
MGGAGERDRKVVEEQIVGLQRERSNVLIVVVINVRIRSGDTATRRGRVWRRVMVVAPGGWIGIIEIWLAALGYALRDGERCERACWRTSAIITPGASMTQPALGMHGQRLRSRSRGEIRHSSYLPSCILPFKYLFLCLAFGMGVL